MNKENSIIRACTEPSIDGQHLKETLGLLHAIENDKDLTQRSLAVRIGVALGLTNTLLRRCLHKGWIKVSQAPARRYAYYLTPKGFREKSRLTAEYISVSLDFFRAARSEYADLLEHCRKRGWRRIILMGAGELTEIASLAVQERGLDVIAIVDHSTNRQILCGAPVAKTLNAELAPEAVLITDSMDSQAAFDLARTVIPSERIFAPSFMHINRPDT